MDNYLNNFVLFHKGPIPTHLKYCLRQIIKTQTNYQIFLLTDNNIVIEGVRVININALKVNVGDLSYYSNDTDPLWRTAFERFFYINSFIIENKIENVIHFDNDVLIYEDVNNFISIFHDFVEHIAITPHKETELVCGFMYIRKSDSLNILCEMLYKLAKHGEKELERVLKSMPHEMRLLSYIQENTNDYIKSLPVSPYEPGNNFYDKFNGVFDPSTYGQFFGNNYKVKDVDVNRLADRFINNGVVPKIDKENKRPFLVLPDNKKIPIFNLHIHNKKLQEYEIE